MCCCMWLCFGEAEGRRGVALLFGGFMAETSVFYPCNPGKNVLCGKTHCALLPEDGAQEGTCRFTTHCEFAADGGEPVRVVLE